jgi:energy-coupling factor transporter transmembrane protein EcfT
MNTTQGVPLGGGPAGPPPRTFVLKINPKVLLVILCIVLSIIVRNPGVGMVMFLFIWWYGLPHQDEIHVLRVEY